MKTKSQWICPLSTSEQSVSVLHRESTYMTLDKCECGRQERRDLFLLFAPLRQTEQPVLSLKFVSVVEQNGDLIFKMNKSVRDLLLARTKSNKLHGWAHVQ